MKNPPFHYHRAGSLADALDLLAEHGDDAKVLAGGQSLLPVMALRLGRPEHVIDIGGLDELASIRVDDGAVTIGAMVRHRTAELSPEVATHAPMVAAALPHVGHRAIRTRGTVVGSIAHADSAAEMPAVCLATDAVMTATSSRGSREIPAAEFFQGFFTTALSADEILTSVTFPAWSSTAGATVVETSRRHGDYAMVGVACGVDVPDSTVTDARIALFGVDGTPVRVNEAEAALVGSAPAAEAFAAAADVVMSNIEPGGDVHASANYRRHLAGVLVRQGLAEAAAKIGAPA